MQKDQHDQHTHERNVVARDPVMVKNMLPGDAWIPGVVLRQLGRLTLLLMWEKDVCGGVILIT